MYATRDSRKPFFKLSKTLFSKKEKKVTKKVEPPPLPSVLKKKANNK